MILFWYGLPVFYFISVHPVWCQSTWDRPQPFPYPFPFLCTRHLTIQHYTVSATVSIVKCHKHTYTFIKITAFWYVQYSLAERYCEDRGNTCPLNLSTVPKMEAASVLWTSAQYPSTKLNIATSHIHHHQTCTSQTDELHLFSHFHISTAGCIRRKPHVCCTGQCWKETFDRWHQTDPPLQLTDNYCSYIHK